MMGIVLIVLVIVVMPEPVPFAFPSMALTATNDKGGTAILPYITLFLCNTKKG